MQRDSSVFILEAIDVPNFQLMGFHGTNRHFIDE